VREAIKARDAPLLYLPAYSPDFNPIEQVFSPNSSSCCSVLQRTQ
jgi:transposase